MKKTYTKPTMQTVEMMQKFHILTTSLDSYGMNKTLQCEPEDEVDDAW